MLRRLINVCLLALALVSAGVANAGAGQVGSHRALLGATPSGILPGAQIDCQFTKQQCWVRGTGYVALSSLLSITRASTGYAADTSGNLVSFPSNTLRITNQGLLVEEARTNLITYSQQIGASSNGWNYQPNVTPTANSIVAPDGTTTATLLTTTASANADRTDNNLSLSNLQYTASVFMKAGTANGFLVFEKQSPNPSAWVKATLSGAGTVVTGGTSGTATATIKAYANGWYRVTLTDTALASSFFGVGVWDGSADAFGFPGCQSGATVYAWGAQLEQAAFATSYIPTTSASATRAADNISVPSLNSLGQVGGVLVRYLGTPTNTSSAPSRGYGWDVSDGGNARLAFRAADNGTSPTFVVGNGTSNTNMTDLTGVAANTPSGWMTAWNAAGTKISQTGRTPVSSATVWAPSANTFSLGSASGNNALNSYFTRFTYWKSDVAGVVQQFSPAQ